MFIENHFRVSWYPRGVDFYARMCRLACMRANVRFVPNFPQSVESCCCFSHSVAGGGHGAWL